MNQDPFAPDENSAPNPFGSSPSTPSEVPPSLAGTPPPNFAGTQPQAFNPQDFGASTDPAGTATNDPAYLGNDGGGGGLPPQVQKSSGGNLAGKIKGGVIVAVLAIVGIGAYASRNDVSVDKVEVGQCLVKPAEGLLTSVTEINCDEPHEMEVYAVVDLEQSSNEAWPGTSAVEERAINMCIDRVEAFIGEDFMASPYDITYITPVEEGWADGDHEGICAVVNFDGTQLTGPINGE